MIFGVCLNGSIKFVLDCQHNHAKSLETFPSHQLSFKLWIKNGAINKSTKCRISWLDPPFNSWTQRRLIIDDNIIQKHRVNFRQFLRRGNSIAEFFDNYGSKMRQFYYNRGRNINPRNSFQSPIQHITRHCSIDQLRDVSIIFDENFRRIDLPLHFQRVKKFTFENILDETVLLSVSLAESLRSLHLHNANLNLNFNWTEWTNL